jgi:leucyl aminopeptidase
MREVVYASEAPAGAVRMVGVIAGEPTETIPAGPEVLEKLGFSGEVGSSVILGGGAETFIVVGLGEVVGTDELRRAAGAAARALPLTAEVTTTLHRLDVEGALGAVVDGFVAGSYRYEDYRAAGRSEPGPLILLGTDEGDLDPIIITMEAVERARDWVNRPPRDKAPAVLAAEMADELLAAGFEVEVWEEERIEQEQLGGLQGVAAGSNRPPRMLVAHRRAAGRPHLALVGKGIVFDSGGLSIKTSEGMETMKVDMAGGAAVAAAAGAIGRLELDLAVSAFVPLTDNMPGGSAQKPGDVVRIRNGKTIEVLNTDAEGRLVLADALSLAAEEQPDLIVDAATLTGAARVALGPHIAAVFAPDDDAREQCLGAAERAGERVWPFPLPPDHRNLIDSTVADMKNTGGKYGGAIAAALLLNEFVGEVPWVHLDIAGPAWLLEDGPLGPKGGSGFGVRTLVELASELTGDRGLSPAAGLASS